MPLFVRFSATAADLSPPPACASQAIGRGDVGRPGVGTDEGPRPVPAGRFGRSGSGGGRKSVGERTPETTASLESLAQENISFILLRRTLSFCRWCSWFSFLYRGVYFLDRTLISAIAPLPLPSPHSPRPHEWPGGAEAAALPCQGRAPGVSGPGHGRGDRQHRPAHGLPGAGRDTDVVQGQDRHHGGSPPQHRHRLRPGTDQPIAADMGPKHK